MLIEDFVIWEEEVELVWFMDCDFWKFFQFGWRKQDYGFKVNFWKQKLKIEGFCGFFSFSWEVVWRMGFYLGLEGFWFVEQCNLDYCFECGFVIDFYLDDVWLWGEWLVSFNFLFFIVLFMCWEVFGSLFFCLVLLVVLEVLVDSVIVFSWLVLCQEVEVVIFLFVCFLLVFIGVVRYQWKYVIYCRYIEVCCVCVIFWELLVEFGFGGGQ